MKYEPIEMSPELRAFLEERVAIKDADSPIARAFLVATVQPDENGDVDNAHNYFDIRNAKVGARLSYTTARKIRESGNLPYAPKGHRVMPPQRIEVVRGETISVVYSGKNNCKCVDTGGLKHSCMRPSSYAENGAFKVYEDAAALAVIFCGQCGNIKARTLLWTDTKGRTWHDRIYANEVDVAMIRGWAHQNNIRSLHARQTLGSMPKVRVNVNPKGYKNFPSMDSMRYCRQCNALKTYYCTGPHTSHRQTFS
jgi:hypothetical protein